MCNFVIRPIKSYATIAVTGEGAEKYETIERGDVVEVVGVSTRVEVVWKDQTLYVDMEDFVHSFIADPSDIEKVKKEESEWFPKKKEKKDSKESK